MVWGIALIHLGVGLTSNITFFNWHIINFFSISINWNILCILFQPRNRNIICLVLYFDIIYCFFFYRFILNFLFGYPLGPGFFNWNPVWSYLRLLSPLTVFMCWMLMIMRIKTLANVVIVNVRVCTIISWIGLRCIGGIVSPLISGIIGGILLVVIISSLHFR